MRIFLRTCDSFQYVEVDANAQMSALQESIRTACGLPEFTLPYAPTACVNAHYRDLQTIRAMPMLLGGGKNMTEEGKALAMARLACTICRNCYARNPVGATTCRKARCGHSANMRPKKIALKKK